MATSDPASDLARRALSMLDGLLAWPKGGAERLDAELSLLLLAAHPGTTPEQWQRVRARVSSEVEALRVALGEVVRTECGLHGVRGFLRHGFDRARLERECNGLAQVLCLRGGELEGLTALLNVLEAEHPALAPR